MVHMMASTMSLMERTTSQKLDLLTGGEEKGESGNEVLQFEALIFSSASIDMK